MGLRIIYAERIGDFGWNPITAMARLMAQLLEVPLDIVPATRSRGRLEKLSGLLPRRRGEDRLLLILPEPVDLQAILRLDHWTRGYSHIAAWVLDAWWTDRIPHVAKHRGHFDHIYVTEHELVDSWLEATGASVSVLPHGTNALDLGSAAPERPIDLQRVGRQPVAWDDDDRNSAQAIAHGLSYAGRPPFHDDADEAMRALQTQIARAKFVLAFSNRVSPASYTHPTREYLTGRWPDALASGATVAGVAPDTEVARTLLWPEATTYVDPDSTDHGWTQVAQAVGDWTPQRSRTNHLHALERFDWRWRTASVAQDFGIMPATLAREITRLEERIASLRAEDGS